jgi:hypothetical protein
MLSVRNTFHDFALAVRPHFRRDAVVGAVAASAASAVVKSRVAPSSELKPDAKPKRIPARKYAPPQALFLAAKMGETWSVLAWLRRTWPPGGQAHH